MVPKSVKGNAWVCKNIIKTGKKKVLMWLTQNCYKNTRPNLGFLCLKGYRFFNDIHSPRVSARVFFEDLDRTCLNVLEIVHDCF